MYNSAYFYGNYGLVKDQKFSITDSDIEKINSLVSSKSESSYYSPQLVWKLSDNPHIKDIEELSRLFVCMQFISMIGKPSQSTLDKHNIKDYHMGLLRFLYLDFDDYKDNAIMMCYKRPFGNSHVLDDVRDEVTFYTPNSQLGLVDDENENYDSEQKILEEFVNFLDDFYKDFEIPYHSFIFNARFEYSSLDERWTKLIPSFRDHLPHSYLRDWDIDMAELRNEKIEKILI